MLSKVMMQEIQDLKLQGYAMNEIAGYSKLVDRYLMTSHRGSCLEPTRWIYPLSRNESNAL